MPTAATASSPGFYRRPLPDGLIAFASPEGRQLFREALADGGMEGWFPLAEQFHTQAEPEFCGLGTLVVALNALEIDPGRIWKGPWRWYGEELLDCCLPLDKVRRQGLTLDELACLARCNGASARVERADISSIEALRADVRRAASAPRGPVVAAAYSRRVLGQTGEGHFSPIGGYHAQRDLALVLDVARFKYPPHWVRLDDLWRAMNAVDAATGKTRGWVTLTRSRAPAALFFRVSLDGWIDDLTRVLLGGSLEPAGGGEPALEAWIAQLDRGIGERLCGWLASANDRLGGMPDEHRRAVAALLTELRSTAAYAAVRRARPAAAEALLRDEALAILLLALPQPVLDALPPGLRDAAGAVRAPPAGGNLAAEIEAVREQLHMLRQWALRGP